VREGGEQRGMSSELPGIEEWNGFIMELTADTDDPGCERTSASIIQISEKYSIYLVPQLGRESQKGKMLRYKRSHD